jgi:hypothetical protein
VPHVDPSVRFWIGVAVTVAIAISGGTLSLTNAVPKDWIPTVTAWSSIIAFLGSSVLTALNGLGSTVASRIASAAAVPGVQEITVDPKLVPNAEKAANGNAQIVSLPQMRDLLKG